MKRIQTLLISCVLLVSTMIIPANAEEVETTPSPTGDTTGQEFNSENVTEEENIEDNESISDEGNALSSEDDSFDNEEMIEDAEIKHDNHSETDINSEESGELESDFSIEEDSNLMSEGDSIPIDYCDSEYSCTAGYFVFEKTDEEKKTATIKGMSLKFRDEFNDEVLHFPSNVGEYTVTKIILESYNIRPKKESLATIIFPDTVEEIGGFGEYYDDPEDFKWPNLRNVRLPKYLKRLGTNCFCNTLIREITIPKTYYVEPQDNGASYMTPFRGSALETVVVEEGTEMLPTSFFSGCEALKNVTLPSSLKIIGNSCFKNCSSLEEINLPVLTNTVYGQDSSGRTITFDGISLGTNMFEGCTSLKNVVFAEGTTIAPDYMFKGCTSLESIEIPDGVTRVNGIMTGCTALKYLKLPRNITYLNLIDCESLEQLSVPNSLNSFFMQGCPNLRTVIFEDGVTSIPATFLRDSSKSNSISQIYIPNSVTSIGSGSFNSTPELTDVYYSGTEEEWDRYFELYGKYPYHKGLANAEIHFNSSISDMKGFSGEVEVTYHDLFLNTCNTVAVKKGLPFSPEIDLWSGYEIKEWYTYDSLNEDNFYKPVPAGTDPIAWYFKDTAVPFDFSKPINENLELYGYSVIAEYSITYELNGGENHPDNPSIYTVHDRVHLIDPKRDGYYFEGWTGTGLDKPEYDYSFPYEAVGDRHLIANWIKMDKKIYYRSQGEIQSTPSFDSTIAEMVNSTDSLTYNTKLAKAMGDFAQSVYDKDLFEKSAKSMGMRPYTKNYFEDPDDPRYGDDRVAYGVGIRINDDGTKTILIACRGSYGSIEKLQSDWRSNFNTEEFTTFDFLDGMKVHSGFHKAAINVLETLKGDFGPELISDPNNKFVITGHSRGAAVANLLEKMISDERKSTEGVYGYNYAVPQVACVTDLQWESQNNYDNIFNIDNICDPVPFVPGLVFNDLFHDGSIASAAFEDFIKSIFGGIVSLNWMKFGRTKNFSSGIDDTLDLVFDENTHAHNMYHYQDFLVSEIDFSQMKKMRPRLFEGLLYSICCPVDITVETKNGTVLASVINGKVINNSKNITDVYIETYEDHKFVLINKDIDALIRIVGTENGIMNYGVFDVVDETENTYKIIENIKIDKDKAFITESEENALAENNKLFVVNEDDNVTAEVCEDGTEIAVESTDNIYVRGLLTTYSYTGTAQKPAVKVYDGDKLLKAGTDYTITYKNNTKAAAADSAKAPTITIKGKGSYTATKTLHFNINPADISEATVAEVTLAQTAKPKTLTVNPKVTWNGKTLKAGTDFTVNYGEWDRKEPGEHTVILKGKGNFAGAKEVTVHVTSSSQTSVSKLKVTTPKISYTDDMTQDTVLGKVTVKDGKKSLIRDTDFEISDIKDCDHAGTCTFVLTGKGEKYYGKRTVSVTITGKSLSKVKASGKAVYNGKEQTLENNEIVLMNGKTPLTQGTDYEIVEYKNNTNAGKASVTIQGMNAYSGKKTVTFTISPDTTERTATVSDAIYEKGGVKPKVTVEGLTEGTDFKVTYKNNTKVADINAKKAPAATVTFIGNYKGTKPKTVNFNITPKDISTVDILASQPVYAKKKGNYKAKITLYDANGTVLKAGTDYTIKYFDEEEKEIASSANLPEDKQIKAIATGKGNYTGTTEVTYSFITKPQDISKAAFKIKAQEYTGYEIELDREDITSAVLKVSKSDIRNLVYDQDYEVYRYINNVKTGTAKVIFRGINGYGGTKTVSFKINKKNVSNHWFEQFIGLFSFGS